MVEKFPAVLEILPQVLRGDFFLTHTVVLLGVAFPVILMKKTKSATSPVETKSKIRHLPHVTKPRHKCASTVTSVMPQRHLSSSNKTHYTATPPNTAFKFYCLHVPIAIATWRIDLYILHLHCMLIEHTVCGPGISGPFP